MAEWAAYAHVMFNLFGEAFTNLCPTNENALRKTRDVCGMVHKIWFVTSMVLFTTSCHKMFFPKMNGMAHPTWRTPASQLTCHGKPRELLSKMALPSAFWWFFNSTRAFCFHPISTCTIRPSTHLSHRSSWSIYPPISRDIHPSKPFNLSTFQ